MKTKKEILLELEEKIKNSGAGIELWFSRTVYDLKVKTGEKTFEEWFEEILEDA